MDISLSFQDIVTEFGGNILTYQIKRWEIIIFTGKAVEPWSCFLMKYIIFIKNNIDFYVFEEKRPEAYFWLQASTGAPWSPIWPLRVSWTILEST